MKSKMLFGLLSLLLLVPAAALADSITPSSFDASVAVGGTVSSLPEPELYLLVLMAALMLTTFMLIKKLRQKLPLRGEQ